APNINVDRARGDVGSVAPNGIEEMIAGKDAAEMACEVIEQAKFGGRGGNGLSADGKDHGRGIDFDVADLERAGWKWTLKPAEQGLDGGGEYARNERRGEVIVGTGHDGEDAIGIAALGSQQGD